MAAPRPRQPHSEGPDFREIKQRFREIGRKRLARIAGDLPPRQQDFLHLLPLLFHVNHPMLPGWVGRGCPAGLPDYSPPPAALKAARRVARSFAFRRRAYRRYALQALYLMGSTGTIAYSRASDFDIWLCHDPALSPEQVELLAAKARGVEAFAAEQGVAANIFLVDPERFRQGRHAPLSHESSGSALHFLLLDEFYRTGVLLAGRYPLWWLVPPDCESDYDGHVAELKRKRFVYSRDHVDLGGLGQVPAEEFYGATLWLLYKGVESPYKSVLKILLMEAYAAEYPRLDLLGLRFKQAVYDGETDPDTLDPYVMMLRRVEAYLAARGEHERLDLVRRCFYYKVGEPLSLDAPPGDGWRRHLLARLCREWGWHESRFHLLDARHQWKLERVRRERAALVGELTRSYRVLSEFARSEAGATALIRPADLNVLGRKLYAAFERKAGKIEILYRGITEDLWEERVTLHRLQAADGGEAWALYRDFVPPGRAAVETPLHRARSVLELLAWCWFNRVLDLRTTVSLYAEGSDLCDRELRAILETFERVFGTEREFVPGVDEYRRPVELRRVATFVNVGLDPFGERVRRGRYLASSRTDALRYGGLLENLALSVDQVAVTSWGEVLTSRHLGVEGLLDCLREHLRRAPPGQGRRPPPAGAVSFSSLRSSAIARRVERLFEDVMDCYYDVARPRDLRYVLAAERHFHVLRMEDDVLHHERLDSRAALEAYLGRPRGRFTGVAFDREALAGEVLPAIYRHNRPGRVQCFYLPQQHGVDWYVLDEHGALFHRCHEGIEPLRLAGQYLQFIGNVHQRMRYTAEQQGREQDVREVELHRLERAGDGDWQPVPEVPPPVPAPAASLQVLDDGTGGMTVVWGEHEFSSLDGGDPLAAAARRLPREARGTSWFIGDLALGGGDRPLQTVDYLVRKHELEQALAAAGAGA